jgi:UDP-N-acetyl-D-glucosamine dehydrogenase
VTPPELGKLVVVGQGYVGLPLALRAAEVGYRVVGYDVDVAKMKRLGTGESPIEDISDERLQSALDADRYLPTTDSDHLADFDVVVISVPTPLSEGNPDLSYITDAAKVVASHLRAGATVVLESTTYPGTTQELVLPLLENGSDLLAGRDFHLGYSPERIDPGNPDWTFENTPKVVSGIDDASLDAVAEFYDRLVVETVRVSSPREAELTKLLENTFRHVNIALVNELAMFAADLDIDVWAAIDAASTKPFGYMRFTPGPGVGGHCLPVDPSYLSWRVKRRLGQSFRFVELANEVNEHMPDYVVRRLVFALNKKRQAINGSNILLLGLAYKKNTGDARESAAIAVADRLLALGAIVRAVDPHVLAEQVDTRIALVELNRDEVATADAVVLLIDHDAFDLEIVETAARYVLDTRNRLERGCVEKL